MAEHSNLKKNPNATVSSINELMSLDSSAIEIIIDNGIGVWNYTVLDLTRFTQLRSLEVGDHCLSYVTMVIITGLSELESVEIGMNSFTKNWGNDPDRHFYLKNCPKLKWLKIGEDSFSDYTVIEIENVDALETIEMNGFALASLELKSVFIHRE